MGLTKAEANLLKALQSIMPKKSTGGQLLATAASFIPGVGPVISPVVSMVDGMIDKSKLEKEAQKEQTPKFKTNLNAFGNFANGGIINEGFKQYDTGSHDSGQDQTVDVNGNPNTANPVAAIQNRENSFKVDGKPFVMSDVLVNPMTGNTINIDAAKLNKKYPQASFIAEDKNALNFGMKNLALINDGLKAMKESVEMSRGGYIKMENGGDPLNPVFNLNTNTESTPLPNFPEVPMDNPFGNQFNIPNSELTTRPEGLATDNTVQVSNPTFEGNPVESSPITDNRSYVPETKQSNPLNVNVPDNWANGVAIGLKAIALGKSIADAARPAEKEKLIAPDYTKSDRYMQSANIDYTQAFQDAMGASNIGANVNRSASNNFAAFQTREQARVAGLSDSLAKIREAENNATSQLNLTRGQYEQGKAVDTANRKYQNRIDNYQNLATKRYADEKLFTELSQIGTEFNKFSVTKEEIANNKELQQYYINEGLAILNNKYTNFNIEPDFIEKLKSGNYSIDDVIKVKMIVDSEKKKTKS